MQKSKSKAKHLSEIRTAVKNLLISLDRDLNNPELRKTPDRVAKLLYAEVVQDLPEKKLFQWSPYPYTSMVTLLGHRTYTRCPHHLERVELDVSVAYIPNGRILGLSKLARIADFYAKGLMLQEEVTDAIAEGIERYLMPKGVAVFIRARHMCMRARGVKSTNSTVVTTCLKGVFLEEGPVRNEFFQTISKEGA